VSDFISTADWHASQERVAKLEAVLRELVEAAARHDDLEPQIRKADAVLDRR
jgi:hypothetical protein